MKEVETSGTCNAHERKQESQKEIWLERNPLRDSDIDGKILIFTKFVNLDSRIEKVAMGWTCGLHVVYKKCTKL
jgi:hypothetical protein